MRRSQDKWKCWEEQLNVVGLILSNSDQHKQMDTPHYEDETEPWDVLIVILEGVVSEPFSFWIKIVSHFTPDLLPKQIEDGTEHLTKEYK